MKRILSLIALTLFTIVSYAQTRDITKYSGNGVPSWTPTATEPKTAQGTTAPFPMYRYDGTTWVLVTSDIKKAATVAELKTIKSEKQGTQIELQGYYASGDGGGQKLYWDATSTETEDSGTVFIVTGVTTGRWKSINLTKLNFQNFGAKADGNTDATTRIQTAINTAIAKKVNLYTDAFSSAGSGYFLLSSPITINGKISLIGGGIGKSGFISTTSSAFIVTGNDVEFSDMTIGYFPRNSNTVNNKIGIEIQGTQATHNTGFKIKNVFIDGYNEGIKCSYAWNMNIDGYHFNFGKIGIHNLGLSVNNFVTNSRIIGTAEAGSIGVYFESNGVDVCEGWVFTNSLVYGFNKLILALETSHVTISNCILDFADLIAIQLAGQSLNWIISNNYIAVSGTNTGYGIYIGGQTANTQDGGHKVIGNTFIAYSGAVTYSGIRFAGSTHSNYSKIEGNSFTNFGANDIWGESANANLILTGNSCNSVVTNNIDVYGKCYIKNNTGTIYNNGSFNFLETDGFKKITFGFTAPNVGTWSVGDICRNINNNGSNVKEWICTAAGTPGTWIPIYSNQGVISPIPQGKVTVTTAGTSQTVVIDNGVAPNTATDITHIELFYQAGGTGAKLRLIPTVDFTLGTISGNNIPITLGSSASVGDKFYVLIK